eukprot:scaffold5526_cov149-Ochromonas_danica.AAC.2
MWLDVHQPQRQALEKRKLHTVVLPKLTKGRLGGRCVNVDVLNLKTCCRTCSGLERSHVFEVIAVLLN